MLNHFKNEKIQGTREYGDSCFNSLPLPALIINSDLNVSGANDNALGFYGYDPEEFSSLPFYKIINSQSLNVSFFKERYINNVVKEFHHKKNGGISNVEVRTTPLANENEQGFVMVIYPVAVENSNVHYQVLSQITEAVVTVSIEGKIIFWNNGAEKIYGYSAAEALGKTTNEIFGLDKFSYGDRSNFERETVTLGEWKTLDIHLTKSGSRIFVESITRILHDENDELNGLIILIRDVTEKMKTEEQLKRSKEELNAILRSVSDGIVVVNDKGKIVYANKAAADMCGASSYRELINKDPLDIMLQYKISDGQGNDLTEDMIPGKKVRSGASIASIEINSKHKTTGRETWTKITSIPVYNESGQVRLVVNVLHDITEQKITEQQIKLSETRFRLLFEQSPFSTQILSPDGYTIEVNKAWELLFGLTLEEIEGYNYFEVKELIETGAADAVKKAIADGPVIMQPVKYKCGRKPGNQDEIWFQLYIYPVKNPDGKIKEVVLIYENFTERTTARENLIRENALRQGIESSIPEGIAVVAPDGKQVYVNPSFCKMVGWKEEELLNKYPPFAYWDDEEIQNISEAFELILTGKAPPEGFEFRFKRKDKTKFYVQLSLSAISGSDNSIIGWLSSVSDITERKMQEEVLKKSEEKYRRLVEGTNALLFATDDKGNFTYLNEAAARAIGVPMENLLGKFYLKYVHPADRMHVHNTFRNLIKENPHSTYIEFRYINENLKEGWFSFVVSPVVEHGTVSGMSGVAQEITERKIAEERIALSLKEKEILLKEVHHRVKNNMQIIYSLLNLQSGSINDGRTLDVFRESQNRIRTMALIHEKLYQSKEITRIDLPGYIKELVYNLLASYSLNNTDIDIDLDTSDIDLNIDSAISVGLIINELVSNSLKYAFAGRHSGRLGVTLLREENGNYNLTVEDDGKGFPGQYNFLNSSTLGLQLVSTLVDQLGGTIDLYRNHGSKFVIMFPSVNREQKV